MQDVVDRGVSESVVVEKDVASIQQCLLAAMDDGYIRPEISQESDVTTIAFAGGNGFISHYTLTPEGAGTRVDVRRRPMIMDHYKKARACFA